ncbi:MAG: FHA domain-containing protein [Candidatus Latescibacterota bacterium]|nr:MAG: FHA domain-containing protein [Candidatus Latescibacterota bacterium]
MDKLMVENQEIDIQKQLAEYRELTKRRSQLEQRIQRVESEKGSVKDHIFEKVSAEYRDALDSLASEIQPVEQAVEKTRQTILHEIETVEKQMSDLQDQLDELAFRCRVGEFERNAREHKEDPLKKQMESFKAQVDDLTDTIKRFSMDADTDGDIVNDNATDDFYDLIEDMCGDDVAIDKPVDVPNTDTSDGDSTIDALADGADTAEEPVDNTVSDTAADDSWGETGTGDSTETPREFEDETTAFVGPKGAYDTAANGAESEPTTSSEYVLDPFSQQDTETIIDESHVPDDLEMRGSEQDLVDPSTWVGEFVGEDAVSDPGVELPPETPILTESDDDPLARLADPTEGGPAPADDPISAHAPEPAGANEIQGFPVLVLTKGPGAGKKLPLLPMTMTLGREHDNNIELKDTNVSRYHARISFERGEYVIEDLEGSSGTWVNGEKIERAALSPGDVIKTGGIEMTIELE